MPYQARIPRTNPTCFLLLVDQSDSMGEPWGAAAGKSKAEGVAAVINRLVYALVDRCNMGLEIYDYYSIGVVGYGGDLSLGFPGELAGEVLRPVSQIAAEPLRMEQGTEDVTDGTGGLVTQVFEYPVWFDPAAEGETRMCQALKVAHEVISEFVRQHPDCFPPVVFNITDGAATDGDPLPWAAQLQGLATSDGNVLLWNIHISKQCAHPIVFPSSEVGLPGENARRLFRMSSPLPPALLDQARAAELAVADGARGFAFNAHLDLVPILLNIGTLGGKVAG